MNENDPKDEELLLIEDISDPAERRTAYEDLIKKTEEQLEEKGFMEEECIGSFWDIEETRPYMKLRHQYMMDLIDAGEYEKALSECETMLRLCREDNIGVRYTAMALYALLEKEDDAFAMYKFFNEESAEMLIPFSVLYYKLGMYWWARRYLLKVYNECDGLIDFLTDDEMRDEAVKNVTASGTYMYGTIEQIADIFINCGFLFSSAEGFTEWAAGELNEYQEVHQQ